MNLQRVFPQFILKKLEEVGSTNLYVEQLLTKERLPEGSVVYTENQSAGIGHADNKWESEPGKNMTATIILNPQFLQAVDQFYITVIASLSVAETVESFLPGIKAQIKWPNDVFAGHRKIAGILIKNFIMGSLIDTSIVGVGLNINQTEFFHAPNATSLKIISGKDMQPTEVLTKWHSTLAENYVLLKNDRQALMDLYLSKMYLKDIPADYLIGDRMVRAAITGVDRHGLLVLCDENNRKYKCGLKEIVFPVKG